MPDDPPPRSEAAGLSILALVDLHRSPSRPLDLPDVQGVDLVLLGGDLTNFRGVEEASAIIEELRADEVAVLAVCGNCDKPEVEGYLAAEELDLDRTARSFGDLKLVGISGGLPFGGCPYERSEGEFEAAADQAFAAAATLDASGPTVLLSHQPPHGTACDQARGRHVGSHAIREAIERYQPELVICGHIHESIGRDHIGHSQIVNPGPWFQGNSMRIKVVGHNLAIE